MNTSSLIRAITIAAIFLLSILCFNTSVLAQSQVTWTNLVGMSQSNDTITQTAATGWGNAGASSVNWLPADSDGYVQFYYNGVSQATFMLGLSRAEIDQNYASIDYAVYFNGGNINIYYSGNWAGSFGTMGTGDSVRITRTGDSIVVSKNGVALYTAIEATRSKLVIDLASENYNKSISNVVTSFGTNLRVDNTVTDVLPPGTNDGSISLNAMGGTSPYTYSWSTGATASSASSLDTGVYTVTVIDNASDTVISNIIVGYQVIWQNTVNVSTTGNSISSSTNSWNAGGSSVNYIPAGQNGYASFTVSQAYDEAFVFGLESQYMDSTTSTIPYGFYCDQQTLIISENGGQVPYHSWPLSVDDVLTIQRVGDSIQYLQNGVEIYGTTTSQFGRMNIDVSMGANAPVAKYIKTNMGVPFSTQASITDQAPTTPNSGAIALTVLSGQSPYTYNWSNGATTQNLSGINAGTFTVTVTDNTGATTTGTFYVGYQVIWQNTVNVSTTGNSISSSTNSWNAGGSSVNYIPAGQNGYASFTVSQAYDEAFVFGLESQYMDVTTSTIPYGFYCDQQTLIISENGGQVPYHSWPLSVDDVLTIQRVGDSIQYLQNGVEIYGTTTSQFGRMNIDVSMGANAPVAKYIKTNMGIPFSATAAITDQVPAQYNTGAIALTVLSGQSPYAYHWSNGATTQSLPGLNAGTYMVTVTDANTATTTGTFIVGYQVSWQNTTDVTTTGNSISSTANSWSAGATSNNYISPGQNGYASFIVSEAYDERLLFGLSNQNDIASSSIPYALYCFGNVLYIIQSNNILPYTNWTISADDTLTILRTGDSIQYFQNATLLHTTITGDLGSMMIDVAMGYNSPTAGYIKTNFGNFEDTTQLYWTGNQDSLWNNYHNWTYYNEDTVSAEVPDTNTTVNFNQYEKRPCYLNTNTTVKAAQIDSGSTVHLQGYSLTVNHDFTQANGTLLGNSATLTINDSLILNGGSFTAPATLNLYNSFTDTLGIFQNNSGTVNLLGNVSLHVSDDLYNVSTGSSATDTLTRNVIATDNITLGSGSSVLLNNHNMQLQNGSSSALTTNTGAGLITGTDNHFSNSFAWKVGENTGTYSIPFQSPTGSAIPMTCQTEVAGGSTSGTMNFSTYAASSSQSTLLYPATFLSSTYDTITVPYPLYSVPRYWLVNEYNYASSPVVGKLTLSYLGGDLANNTDVTESRLVAYRYNGSGWDKLYGTVNTTAHTFTIDSVKDTINIIVLTDSITTVLPPVAPTAQTYCSNSAHTFTFSGVTAGIHGNQIEWATNSAFTGSTIINSPATITVTVSAGATDSIWIRSKDSVSGNVSSAVVTTATVNILPTASITPMDTFVLQGQWVTLTASGGTSYSWPGLGESTSTVTVIPENDSTYYTVIGSNSYGCTDTVSALVRAMPFPIITDTNYNATINSGDSTYIIIHSTDIGMSITWTRDNDDSVSGPIIGYDSIIKIPLTNYTRHLQKTNFTVRGSANGYHTNSLLTSVYVAPGSPITTMNLGFPSTVTACNDTIYQLTVTSKDTGVFTIKIGFEYPPLNFQFGSIPSGFTDTLIGDTAYFYSGHNDTGTLNFYYSFAIPCSAINPVSAAGSQSQIFTQIITATDNAGDTLIQLDTAYTFNYPFLSDTAQNGKSYNIKYQQIDTIALQYKNGGAPFNGAVEISKVFYCDSNIIAKTLEILVGDSVDTTINFPFTYPVIIPRIFIPHDSILAVLEIDSMGGCISPTCNNINYYLEWGCNLSSLCDTDSSQVTFVNTDGPGLVIYRALPLPGVAGDTGQYAKSIVWDTACANSFTQWEYIIKNDGNIALHSDTIQLATELDQNMGHTFIVANSIQVIVNDTQFYNVVPITDTALQSTVAMLTTTSIAPGCLAYLEDTLGDGAISGYTVMIPWLLPDQQVVIKFQTFRCCASDNLFNQPVNYNNWMLTAYGYDECDNRRSSNGAAQGILFLSESGHPTRTYVEDESTSNAISPDNANEPNLELQQQAGGNNPGVIQGADGGGYALGFSVENNNFMVPAESNTALFCDLEALSGSTYYGLNPAGKLKVVIQVQPYLLIDTTSPTITDSSVSAYTWNSSFTWGSDSAIAVFDMASLPDSLINNSLSFLQFFTGSYINFWLKSICPFSGNPEKDYTVSTYFSPGNCITCWIPLSQVTDSVQLFCPGCITPGWVSFDTLTRVNYGYDDSNNNGLPDSPLTHIDSNYIAHHAVAFNYAIDGDTLKTTTTATFFPGYVDSSGQGFSYNMLMEYWESLGDTVGLPYLYIEHHITNSYSLGISCYSAVLQYFPAGGMPVTDTLVRPDSVMPANSSDVFLFRIPADSLGVTFAQYDSLHIIQYYTICQNPDSVKVISPQNYIYFAKDSLASQAPYVDGAYLPAGNDTPVVLANYGPGTNFLYYCEALFDVPCAVYPVLKFVNQWATSYDCSPGFDVDIAYYIADPAKVTFNGYALNASSYQNVFPYEYRMMPGITDSSGIIQSHVSLQITVPHDLAARINYAQTHSYEIDSLKTNFLIQSSVAQNVNDSLIFPTDSIVVHGPNDSVCTVFVNISKVTYSPPFKNLNYTSFTDSLVIDNIGGMPALTIGDEHFEQVFHIDYYPRCDSAIQSDNTIADSAFVSQIPGFGCADTPQSAGIWPSLYLVVPHDTFISIDTPVIPNYYGNYIDWSITINNHALGAQDYMVIFIPKAIADSKGLVTKDTIGSNEHFAHDTIDMVIDTYYRFPITDTVANLEVRMNNCSDSINIPYYYSWSCNGLPDTLPPGRNFCDTLFMGNLKAYIAAPFLQDSVINTPAGNYKTCQPVPVLACISSGNQWGVGNFTGGIALPDDIIIDTSSVYLAGTRHVPGSLIDTAALTDSTRLWTINLNSYTQLGSSSSIFDSVTGFTVNSPPMCLNFNLVVTSCNVSAIPNDSVTFTGIAYCDTPVAASCSFDSIFLHGNGCGPLDSLTKSGDTSCTLSSIHAVVFGDTSAPYAYVWSTGASTATIDSLQSNSTYTITITDSKGCYNIDSETLNYTDGIKVNLAYTGSIGCFGPGPDSIFSDAGYVKYQWNSTDTTENLSGDTTMNNLFNVQLGEYYLTITDTNGCKANDSIYAGPYSPLYILTNIKVSEITDSVGTGDFNNALPYIATGTGDSVNNVEILIVDTLWVDTDLVINNSPYIYMAPDAIIIVENNHTLTLSSDSAGDTTTLLASCDSMYKGIVVQPEASVIFKTARVRDADSAVYAHGGGTLFFKDVIFTQNFKSIVIDSLFNYDSTYDSIYVYDSVYPLHMDSVTFRSEGPLLAPHSANARSNVGIEVNNVWNIHIGSDASGAAIYYGMDTAINLINSGAIVTNQFIKGDTIAGIGVGINARDNMGFLLANAQLGPAVQIGDTMTNSNTILSCDTGIRAIGFSNSQLEIGNNYVRGNDSAALNILIANAVILSTDAHVYIHGNKIYKGQWGIYLYRCQTYANIDSNLITFAGSNSTRRMGITFVDSLLTLIGDDTLYGNELDSVYHGITDTFRYHQHIIENTITLATYTGTTDTCTGISLYQSPFARLGCNYITGYDASTEASGYGISCDSSTGTLMLNNYLKNLGVGIMNFGQQRVQLIDNILDTSAVGIGISGTNAVIGNQGIDSASYDTTYDNEWVGAYAIATVATYIQAEKPVADIFYVQSYPVYNPLSGLLRLENSNFITVDTITPNGEYAFPGNGCIPPPPLELRTFWTGNNPLPPGQDTTNNMSTSQLDYKLIPNLFKDNFSARITLGNFETGEVDIYNIEGLLIESYVVGHGVNQLNLSNPELVGGVYIYKVFVNGQIKTTDKLVVVH